MSLPIVVSLHVNKPINITNDIIYTNVICIKCMNTMLFKDVI